MRGKERNSPQIDQNSFNGSVALRLGSFLLGTSFPQTVEEQTKPSNVYF